jgi:hypothetical protein
VLHGRITKQGRWHHRVETNASAAANERQECGGDLALETSNLDLTLVRSTTGWYMLRLMS